MKARFAVEVKAESRLGVFGSSFDPPTLGHAVLLGEACWRLDLDRVILVPTGDAWHKEVEAGAAGEARIAMAEIAFGSIEGIEVSDNEINRSGPSYTCDTLEEIQSSNPDSQILFLTGADAAVGIREWHRPERVLELARFAVADRTGIDREAVEKAFESLDASDRLDFFEMPRVEISSTLVRERIGSGQPWKHLVPHQAAQMIENKDLYGRNQ